MLLIVYVLIFWFLTVLISQDHHIDWVNFGMWTFVIHAIGSLTSHFLSYAISPFLSSLIGLVMIVGGLYWILADRVGELESIKRWKIIGIYFTTVVVLTVLIRLYINDSSARLVKILS